MEVTASAKQIRISANKVRRVLALVRGKNASEALMILKYTPNKPARYAEKVLKSAVANAENNFEMDPEKLYVEQAFVDAGPILKRGQPRAHGRMFRINKRTSHITVVVAEKE